MFKEKYFRWAIAWFITVGAVAIWDFIFLNTPAFRKVASGFVNTILISLLSIIVALVFGWITALLLHHLETTGNRKRYLLSIFFLNLIRSIPQIIGILFGYIAISYLAQHGVANRPTILFPLLAVIIGIFTFLEIVDLLRDRIAHFSKLDFYNAMRVCGISESRIVNFHILWKNSKLHIFNKVISLFGTAIFLQCSVDFIISVGLSTDINSVNLPATLGGLLAKIDSKQDILAIGYTLTHPDYIGNLFFQHLQGLTIAFLIVFTLCCIYNISNAYAKRHRL